MALRLDIAPQPRLATSLDGSNIQTQGHFSINGLRRPFINLI